MSVAPTTSAECGWCGGSFPQVVRGRPAKFCSASHGVMARRAVGRLVREQCVECGEPINQERRVGRPRVVCVSDGCFQLRRAKLDELRDAFAAKAFKRMIDSLGISPSELLPPFGYGYGREMPLPRSKRDIDPLSFPFGWDAQAFVDEFGSAGCEVGETNSANPMARVGGPASRVMGPTLGRGSESEPILV